MLPRHSSNIHTETLREVTEYSEKPRGYLVACVVGDPVAGSFPPTKQLVPLANLGGSLVYVLSGPVTVIYNRVAYKVTEARAERIDALLSECTFHPTISPPPPDTPPPRDLDLMANGTVAYLFRRRQAREREQEVRNCMDRFDGSTWKRQKTIPREFRFATASPAKARRNKRRNNDGTIVYL